MANSQLRPYFLDIRGGAYERKRRPQLLFKNAVLRELEKLKRWKKNTSFFGKLLYEMQQESGKARIMKQVQSYEQSTLPNLEEFLLRTRDLSTKLTQASQELCDNSGTINMMNSQLESFTLPQVYHQAQISQLSTRELQEEIAKTKKAIAHLNSVFPDKRTDYSVLVGELLGEESIDLEYDREEMLRQRRLSPQGNNEMLRLSVKLMSRERRELKTEVKLSHQGSVLFGSESSEESKSIFDDLSLREFRANFDSLKANEVSELLHKRKQIQSVEERGRTSPSVGVI